MLLLVDGYNVSMRDPHTASLSKEAQRDSLVARLAAHAPTLAPRGSIVVVFDARGSLARSAESARGAVTPVYAPDADDEIVRRCSVARGEVRVVTDDMRLRARISQDVGRHVVFVDAAELSASALKAASRSSRPAGLVRETGMPQGANEITEELKKLWLAEDEE